MSENTKPVIAEICEAYGLSQTALAKKFEIPLRTVQDWHAGRRNPPAYVVNMMVKLLIIERNNKKD
jgi:putative transcriptional regulator